MTATYCGSAQKYLRRAAAHPANRCSQRPANPCSAAHLAYPAEPSLACPQAAASPQVSAYPLGEVPPGGSTSAPVVIASACLCIIRKFSANGVLHAKYPQQTGLVV